MGDGPGTKEVHIVPPERRATVANNANIVTVRGVVRGTWKIAGRQLALTWLDSVPAPIQDMTQASSHLANALDHPLNLTIRSS